MKMLEKIFQLQQSISLNKDKTAKNYIYRSLDDMLLYLKPHFNELKIVGIFSDGSIEANIKRICFTMYNIEEPTDIFTVSDSCVIDLNPKIMSVAQSSNATDTFLQKRILEHLLLLTTEPDPDSIPLPEPEKPEPKKPEPIEIILNNAEKAKMGKKEEMLVEATKFDNFKGFSQVSYISEKVKEKLESIVSDAQIKRLMAISNKKNITDENIKALIKKVWGKDSKKELNNLEYNILVSYIESKPDVEKKT